MQHLAAALAITFALTGASLAAGEPGTAEVVIIIDGVDPGKGMVEVAFCNAGPLEQCTQFRGKQPASAETLGFRFENIPPGRYAFVGFQDLDSSGEMERNFFGMPEEPFALGNAGMDIRLFPPPDFDEIATSVVEGPNTERLTLRTMSGTAKKPDAPTLPPEAVPLMLVEPPKP